MNATDEEIAALLRRGHPDADTYAPPPFATVVARQARPRPLDKRPLVALAAFAAVVVVAVVGSAFLRTTGIGSAGGAPVGSVLTDIDIHSIAAQAGVPDLAVIPLGDDTAVTVRWRDGRVELLRAKLASTWTLTIIGSVAAPRPPGSASAVVANMTCIDPNTINGPAFVYGSLIENDETTLRIHTDYVAGDVRLNDGAYLFVIPAQPGEAFWIDGPNDPGAPSPWPTAAGVGGPAHAGAYFAGTIAKPNACPGFGGAPLAPSPSPSSAVLFNCQPRYCPNVSVAANLETAVLGAVKSYGLPVKSITIGVLGYSCGVPDASGIAPPCPLPGTLPRAFVDFLGTNQNAVLQLGTSASGYTIVSVDLYPGDSSAP